MKKFLLIFQIFSLSAFAALIGLGFSYDHSFSPQYEAQEHRGIYADGWLTDGAVIELPALAERGNQVILRFSEWHPEDKPPAQMRVSLCDRVISEFTLTPGQKTQRLYLTDSCNPKRVSFDVLNPFIGSPTDPRKLGAQLDSFEVTSKFGFPIVKPEYVLVVTAAIALLTLAYALSLGLGAAYICAAALPAISGFVLSRSANLDLELLTWLWLVFACVGAGLYVGTHVQRADEPATARSSLLFSIAAIAIVTVGALLRFYNLDFGLPLNFHPDEVPKYNAVMRMRAAGDLNPRYFLHPSLLLYSSYGMNVLLHYVTDIGTFEDTLTFAGRLVSATAGTLSIYVVYRIGRILYGPLAGLYGALFLAVFPLHITCSRYVKEDALLTFIILLSAWAYCYSIMNRKKAFLLVSGLLAGFAASTKYSGLLCIAYLAVSPFLVSDRVGKLNINWILVAVSAMLLLPIGFVMLTPYSIMDSATFLKDFSHESNHMNKGHTILIDAWSQFWMYHVSRSIADGMTVPALISGLIGVGLLLGNRVRAGILLLGFVILFYLPAEYVKAKPAPQPDRYILPCLPFLALGTGVLFSKLQRSVRPVLVIVLMLLFLFFPADKSIRLARALRPDTREVMADWMLQNIPHGSKVYVDWRPYAPQFPNNEFQLEFLPRARIIPSLAIDDLKAKGDGYLVLSSLYYGRYFTQPNTNPALRESIRNVFRNIPIVKQIGADLGAYGFHNPTLTLFSLFPNDVAKLEQELQLVSERKQEQTSNQERCSYSEFASLCTLK